MKNTYFVAGTDTGVGKTYVAAALLELARRRGMSAYGVKPVAAGGEMVDGRLQNEDAILLSRHATVELSYDEINPVVLKAPIAPHIAALQEGRRLQLERIEGRVRGTLTRGADLRLIEGAGGWRVPLARGEYLSGLVQRLQCPVILVVGMRLGCLNHAVLTAEAIARDGLALAGWVANELTPAMPARNENLQTLASLIPAPCLGVVPFSATADVATAAEHLALPGDGFS